MLLRRSELPVERWYATIAVSVAARLSGDDGPNPVPVSRRVLEDGSIAFMGSCSVCHGATGDGRGVFGPGMYPAATDLLHGDVVTRSDGQLFWIIRNGLSFTGMPGFGEQYDDAALWGMIHYLRALQHSQGEQVAIPGPTREQLAAADPSGDAPHRGAATYFAQACDRCHGAVGEAPDELALRPGGAAQIVRDGRPAMPAYGPDRVTDRELGDLEAYVQTFRGLLQRQTETVR